MTSSRPYIIRAIYEWIVDNGLTPYILVDTHSEAVVVPRDYIENNRIILNISMQATQGLALENDNVSFSARFGGKPMNVFVPTSSVLAIYAQENGQGMMFGEAEEPQIGAGAETPAPAAEGSPERPGGPDDDPSGPSGGGKKPSLKIVK
ncbi:ClpXP protease specificity-enhancing factor [Granulosicoccaceae sp. 1_MG-2023]|nr:ClpXP protease specificity-enhancing factor [Granulosicoccaceae sp. 1_MG-2023]